MCFTSRVFEGPNAVKDFLNPENSPPLPLVELPEPLNPFRNEGVRIFAKLMFLLPLLNMKCLPALNMLLEAEAAGKLQDVDTIVENSSGNTAFSLTVLARIFGIPHVAALVPWDIAPGKLDLLRLIGADPRLQRESPDGPNGIDLAREYGRNHGNLNPGQYHNEANPAAYEKWVAPEIWEQSKGKLTLFTAGLGTTGTLVGISRYLRRKSPVPTIVGAICAPGSAVPGVRSESRLRPIGFEWRKAVDAVVEVETKESFRQSLNLFRAGIMGGPSSGFALAALLDFIETAETCKTLDELRNSDGDVYAVFICGDTPFPYLDKYSTHLDLSDIPSVMYSEPSRAAASASAARRQDRVQENVEVGQHGPMVRNINADGQPPAHASS
jgi:cysteine synthase